MKTDAWRGEPTPTYCWGLVFPSNAYPGANDLWKVWRWYKTRKAVLRTARACNLAHYAIARMQ